MKHIVLKIVQAPIKLYRWLLSPLFGPKCRFYPTCSAYTLEALEAHGIFKGLLLGLCRIVRCHPWNKTHGHDPVPSRFTWGTFFGYNRRQKTHNK